MKLFLALLFFLFFPLSNILADDFTLTGDSSQNGFYSTISYLINRADIQNISSVENTISFNMGDIYGKENILIGNEVFSIFFNNGYWRENGVNEGTYVSAPPMGYVDVFYQYWNNAGHDVNISQIAVAYTKNSQEDLPLTSYLDFSYGQELSTPISFLYSGVQMAREGLLRRYEGVGNIGNGEYGFKFLDRITIKQPIEVLSINSEKIEEGIKVSINLRNNSYDRLDNLYLSHNGVSVEFSLLPQEEKVIEYVLPFEESVIGEVNLGSFSIENRNSHRKCSVQGTNFSPEFNKNAVSEFSFREDGGWIAGASIGPSQDSYCIDRIPYTVTSAPVIFSSNESILPEREENVPEEESIEEEVLGIDDTNFSVLPETAFFTSEIIWGSALLLVLDGFLWYSVFRKGENEYKNTLTKLCSKSRKNSSKRRL